MMLVMRNWWLGLSQRERVLVGIAAALSIPLLVWFAIVAPLAGALASAQERHRTAVDRYQTIVARTALAESLRSQSVNRPPMTGRVDLVISQSAAEQGFTLSRNDSAGENAASIAIGSARTAALMAWIGQLEDMGLVASDLTIRPNANGTVALTATMRRAR